MKLEANWQLPICFNRQSAQRISKLIPYTFLFTFDKAHGVYQLKKSQSYFIKKNVLCIF